MATYGVISDTHCHNWSMFSKLSENGINSRLEIILNEIKRAAASVKEAGGRYLFHAGDIFHVRGTISPSVMNPVINTFREIIDMGITPVLLCGNHDSEFRLVNDVGSAISAFREIGCLIANSDFSLDVDDRKVVMIPWEPNAEKFQKTIENWGNAINDQKWILICHAPLSDVLPSMNNASCFSHTDIKSWAGDNCDIVFAGHIHNHKDLGQRVYSVGAIAHHNWRDVDTKAGFIIVKDNAPRFFASHAPRFVEINGSMSEDEILLLADGNYIRATVTMTEAEIKDLRTQLEKAGARGVTIICHQKAEDRANRMEIKTSESLESIVSRYTAEKLKKDPKNAKIVFDMVNELMAG